MKYRTAFVRLSKTAFCGVLLLTGALTIGYFTPRRWNPSAPNCADNAYRVYIAGDAMHVNFVVPAQNSLYDWRKFLDFKQIGSKGQENYAYLKLGWGDRRWYTETPSWEQINVFDIFRVLFKPGNTAAMYVRGYSALPADNAVELRCIALDRTEYLNLMQFLRTSFEQTPTGKPIYLKSGASETDGFFAATGTYSALRTCNTWTAEGLDTANVPTPLWSALSASVMRHAKGCPCS